MARAFLLLGSNIGDLKGNIQKAIQHLIANGMFIRKKSRYSMTKPWGREDQPAFLNLVMEIETEYDPIELLAVCKAIELAMGRKKRGVRWGPRIIDLDIIFYEDRIISTEELIVPHPQFLNRPFAIELLNEIAPHFVYPGTSKKIEEYRTPTI